MHKYHEESYTKSQKLQNTVVLSSHKDIVIPLDYLMLKMVEYHTSDGYFGEEAHIHYDQFINVHNIMNGPLVRDESNKNILMENRLSLAPVKQEIHRKTYNVFNLMSEMGGFLKVIQFMLMVAILPVTENMYLLTMMSRMYFAKTTNKELFTKMPTKKQGMFKSDKLKYLEMGNIPKDLLGTGFERDIKNNQYIQLSFLDKLLILPHFYIPGLNRISCWKKRYAMTTLWRRGRKKLYKDLNIFHVVNRVNYIMMLLKQTGKLTQRSFWMNNHLDKNVINCDSCDGGHSTHSCEECTSEEVEKHTEHPNKLHLASQKYEYMNRLKVRMVTSVKLNEVMLKNKEKKKEQNKLNPFNVNNIN